VPTLTQPRDAHDVEPLPGLVPWIGGKRNLARRLAARIDAIPHTCYAEPFVGMGGVFFRRRKPSRVEAINDCSRDVATLFRMLQRHPDALFGECATMVASAAEFERQARLDPDLLTDVERAARLIYLQSAGWGGKVIGRTFGRDCRSRIGFYWPRLQGRLQNVRHRLQGVYIDCLTWEKFIAQWDGSDTLFYLDPPYQGAEAHYGKGLFARDDFIRLADILSAISGHFILSVSDTPLMRATFSRFAIEPIDTIWHIGTASGLSGRRSELVVTDGR